MVPPGLRLVLVAHGFPPYERAGVENYTAGIAAEFARRGAEVHVFAPRRDPQLPDASLRTEERDGYRITWVNSIAPPRGPREALDPPRLAERFATWLDVERPDVVHLQHVVKLGLGFVEVAKERGIPVVLTAHDYYGVCSRFTLLRPDLTRCDVLSDADRCARCDLATGVLDAMPELGDYHLGVDPSSLPEEARERIAALLDGRPEDAGVDRARFEDAVSLRAELEERRARVFASVDVILSPTEFLADTLRRGGVHSDRLRVLSYGIDTEPLAPARAIERPRRPLRIGYVGSMTKHKGVHVLISAFERLGRPAELHVHGDSTDRVHAEAMRKRTLAAGGTWHGAFGAVDRAGVLERIDVLAAPSLWFENQPLAIREAFAAGIPVVTSDLGALPESVRDGVDGLLVPPGDADALAAALRRLIDEPGLYERLRANVPPVKGVSAHVDELAAVYEEVRARAAKPPPGTEELAHLAAARARFRELDRLPLRVLFERVVGGLERLEGELGVPERPAHERMVRALTGASRAREELRDLRAEAEWRREQMEHLADAVAALRAESDWRAGQVEELTRARDWLRDDRDRLADEKSREREWLDGRLADAEARDKWRADVLDALERERAWLRQQIENAEKERTWLRGEVAARDAAATQRAEEIAWMRGLVSELEREVAWRRAADREGLLAAAGEPDEFRAALARLRSALDASPAEREAAFARLAELDGARSRRLAAALAAPGSSTDAAEARAAAIEAATSALEAVGESTAPGVDPVPSLARLVTRLADEVRWRRAEMAAAGDDIARARWRHLLARTRIGRRARGWRERAPGGDA